MKYVVLVPDGAADRPLKELGGKTPLQAAQTPNMDFLAKEGIVGTVKTVPPGMIPGSDVANLAILGYDPQKHYTGRGALEAVSRGIFLKKDEVAFRLNLITAEDDILKDYSAGHIESGEAQTLIQFIQEKLGEAAVHFYPGMSYRHLLIVKGKPFLERVKSVPPHNIVGKSMENHLPQGRGSAFLKELMVSSRKLLEAHPLNLGKKKKGQNQANMIWLWGQGKTPTFPTFKEKFGLSGAIISAVDLIKGIGYYAGLRVLTVPGATGYFDTNYEGKAEAALEALKTKDFVFVHVEAPDEAGHEALIGAKIKTLEDFDERLVRIVLEGIKKFGSFKIIVVTDHATPIAVRTHTRDAVPFALYSSLRPKNEALPRQRRGRGEVQGFDEISAKKGKIHLSEGCQLMNLFIKNDYTDFRHRRVRLGGKIQITAIKFWL